MSQVARTVTDEEIVERIIQNAAAAGYEITPWEAADIIRVFAQANTVIASGKSVYLLEPEEKLLCGAVLDHLVPDDSFPATSGSAHEALNRLYLEANRTFAYTPASRHGHPDGGQAIAVYTIGLPHP